MKKTTKFLSLLLFAPLLTGCGNGVKAPKFAKYGDEVKFDKFYKNLNAAFEKSTLLSEKKTLGSVEMKGEYAEFEGSKITRDKKTYSNVGDLYDVNYSSKVDPENCVYESKNVLLQTSEAESAAGKTSEVFKQELNTTYQVATIKKHKWFVVVQHERKEYSPAESLDGVKEKEYFDALGKGAVLTGLEECVSSIETQYGMEDDEGKKDYKFYQNGDIFTVEMNWEEEQKLEDGDGKYATQKSTCKWIVQLDMTEGKWSGKEFMDSKSVTEHTRAIGQFVKGDILEESYIRKQEFSAQAKKFSLKAQDLSKYKYIGE